ncbi:MAG: hypothetical protein MUO54_12635 [Anaerolineales bacterium]|nr:hypothetical protein [Anaerolineales bacterium]
MNKFPENPTIGIILVSLAANILVCCSLLPLAIQPNQIFTARQLLETLMWQGLAAIGWILPLLLSFLAFIRQGSLSDLGVMLRILIYPLGQIALILLIVIKNYKWIPLIVLHILIILSFIVAWIPVLKGYDFMIG